MENKKKKPTISLKISDCELFLEHLLLSSPFGNGLLIAQSKIMVPFLNTFFHILILINQVTPWMHLANLFIQLIVGATLEPEQKSSSSDHSNICFISVFKSVEYLFSFKLFSHGTCANSIWYSVYIIQGLEIMGSFILAGSYHVQVQCIDHRVLSQALVPIEVKFSQQSQGYSGLFFSGSVIASIH